MITSALTYRDLLHRLQELSSEQLDSNVSVLLQMTVDEYQIINIYDTILTSEYQNRDEYLFSLGDLPLLVSY